MKDETVLTITIEKRPDGLYRPNVESHGGRVALPCCSGIKNALENAAKEARRRFTEMVGA